jgi:low temperature requirement protein LtrA
VHDHLTDFTAHGATDRGKTESVSPADSHDPRDPRDPRDSRDPDAFPDFAVAPAPRSSGGASAATRRRRLNTVRRQGEQVTPLELFFDLIFVLAVTQCTAMMATAPTWSGVARALVVLATLWWAWVGYAWLTSVVDPEEGAVRFAMFGAMAALLVVTLCIPLAFDGSAVAFAIAYGVVRAGQIVLFTLGSRDEPELRQSIIGLAGSSAIGVALIAVASAFDGSAQLLIWVGAVVLDVLGPFLFGSKGWQLEPRHFAERHGLIVIIALGESIVAIGVGASDRLDGWIVAAVVVGVAAVSAMWWTYFDVTMHAAGDRLERAPVGKEQNELARDAYSYSHFPMVAGIVLFALGLKKTLGHVTDPLGAVPAAALGGGAALYYLGHTAFRLRVTRSLSTPRFALAVVLIALLPAMSRVDALAALVIITALLWAVIAYEAVTMRDVRRRIRTAHGHGSTQGDTHGDTQGDAAAPTG